MSSIFNPPVPASGARAYWRHVYGSALGLGLSALAGSGRLLVVVTRDMRSASIVQSQLQFFTESGGDELLPFPDWECLPYDSFSPHPDIISQRLLTLYRLSRVDTGIVVLPVSNLMQRLPPRDYVISRSFILRQGEELDATLFRERLSDVAYYHTGQVLSPGEFAVRGGVFDVFPMGSDKPLRIDLFGDQIDGLRFFDPESQRSTETVHEVQILPAREFPFDEESRKLFRSNFRNALEGDPRESSIYTDVSAGLTPSGIEYYFPLFFESTATLFDFLPENAIVVTQDDFESACEYNFADIRTRFEAAELARDNPPLAPERLFLSPDQTFKELSRFSQVGITAFESDGSTSMATRSPPSFTTSEHHRDRPLSAVVEFVLGFNGRALLTAESPGRREVLEGLLADHDLQVTHYEGWHPFLDGSAPLGLAVTPLDQGLLLEDPPIAVITESQIFGDRVVQRRRRGKVAKDPDAVIRSLAELRIGDPVVHEDHGVGRYRGLSPLTISGNETEFLTIEYHGGDKLYLPILSLGLVSRYVGAGPDSAPLHKLGSEQWLRARGKAKDKAYDVAAELLETQALRNAHPGFAYAPPDDSYRSFTEGFLFEETPDQAQVIEEVFADMQGKAPMDRLVCGDVGFGKTEVALRAVFLAIHSGRQVVLLTPTTLLAQQHYETFCDRFANFPVKVDLLSRFRSVAQIKASLELVKSGQVDVLIGTHRVLQKDISFRDLGLIIIDEEHRFGVRQKERLKQLRSEVDVLTLTATPIPRTLNKALSGLRDISIIGTPPRARLSVKTFVREWNSVVLREACLREIRRGGQVYFLHNEVKTIDSYRERLEELVPEAHIQIAHGQMSERDLEKIMSDFYHQRFNLLLCTTIIESGIDVPSANTIIINRADRFGLAQLHQLRGRVGRSHHQAYAYLLTPPKRSLTPEAFKRLQAIESLDDLGAGFALASHDLEIRGAGEILGEAQSGTIDEVGFTMYTEFLRRAIETLKSERNRKDGREPSEDLFQKVRTEINLHLPALLPSSYVPDVHERLVFYKRIANCETAGQLDDLKGEAIDRFGSLPEAASTLFDNARLSLRASDLGIESINLGPRGGRIRFAERTPIDPGRILTLIRDHDQIYEMRDAFTLVIKDDLSDESGRMSYASRLIRDIAD